MATILVVDDSSMSRRTLRKILETEAYTVIEAADGLSALEHFVMDKPDMVLLDLTMNGMSGLDVLVRLRELDPAACVIVASADIQSTTRSLVQDAGAHAFINKPFSSDTVLQAVRAADEGRS